MMTGGSQVFTLPPTIHAIQMFLSRLKITLCSFVSVVFKFRILGHAKAARTYDLDARKFRLPQIQYWHLE